MSRYKAMRIDQVSCQLSIPSRGSALLLRINANQPAGNIPPCSEEFGGCGRKSLRANGRNSRLGPSASVSFIKLTSARVRMFSYKFSWGIVPEFFLIYGVRARRLAMLPSQFLQKHLEQPLIFNETLFIIASARQRFLFYQMIRMFILIRNKKEVSQSILIFYVQ